MSDKSETLDVAGLIARLERFADANGADTSTCREVIAVIVGLRKDVELERQQAIAHANRATKARVELAAANKLIDDEKTGKLISYLNVLAQENKTLRRMSHADRAEKAEAERDALREDAERYSIIKDAILREYNGLKFLQFMHWAPDTFSAAGGFNAAIDAARAKG